MTRRLLVALLTFALSMGVGCATQKTTGTLPTGAVNAFDADTNRALQDAHAFVGSLQQQVATGSYTPSASVKALLNQTINSLNAADVTYQAYHTAASSGGNPSTAPVTTAVTNMQTNLTKLQTAVKP